jgi:plastocyanin
VFKPVKLTIKAGTKVVWVNRSDAPHTVTSRTKSWKYNKKMNVRKNLSFVFRKAGTFKYYCIYHPGMAGTIVVKR